MSAHEFHSALVPPQGIWWQPAHRQEKTWIAIQLLDDESSPVPQERYQIEASDGETREGRLDKQGFARIDGIAAGNAKVRFPELDGSAWSKA